MLGGGVSGKKHRVIENLRVSAGLEDANMCKFYGPIVGMKIVVNPGLISVKSWKKFDHDLMPIQSQASHSILEADTASRHMEQLCKVQSVANL